MSRTVYRRHQTTAVTDTRSGSTPLKSQLHASQNKTSDGFLSHASAIWRYQTTLTILTPAVNVHCMDKAGGSLITFTNYIYYNIVHHLILDNFSQTGKISYQSIFWTMWSFKI